MDVSRKRRIVVKGEGRQFAVTQHPSFAPYLVVEDMDEERVLGPPIMAEEPSMFSVEIEGKTYALFAGLDDEAHHVTIDMPADSAVARVFEGCWLSFPMPFEDNSPLTVVWHDESGRELRRYQQSSLPLGWLSGDISEWTMYAPLDEG